MTTVQQLAFFAIVLIAFVLLITERLRNDLVAVLIMLSLAISGILTSSEALSGFSSEAAIVVACIFVLSGTLEQTGVSEAIGQRVGRLTGRTYSQAIAVIMPAVALGSAFTHHLTTTAIMLPVLLDFSRERNIPASKLLMPLSFAASLGTTITIIGAPAFLIASQILQQAGRPALGVFSVAPIGLALSALGTVFMLLIGRFLLPSRQGGTDLASRFRFENYYTELAILPDSPLIGKTLEEVKAQEPYHFTVVGWNRDGQPLRLPFADFRLRAGDVLRVHTTPEDLIAFRQDPGIELHPIERFGDESNTSPAAESDEMADQLVQAVVAPNADLVGRTLSNIDFRRRFGALVVGLWRRNSFLRDALAKVKLRAGDVLVIQGDPDAIARVQQDPAFLMLVPFQTELRNRRKASLAVIIMLVTVVVVSLNLVPLQIGTLAGAAAAVLTGCITTRRAYRAIDARIFVFIAGAIPLGLAMQKTGASALIAGWLQHTVGGWSPFAILLVIFAVVSIITQFLSDAATTALFGPVAVALAQALGHAPEPFVVTVAMASIAAFITPIGHHGNLVVYGPGQYEFGDFVKVGTPLTILIGLVVCALSLVLWPG